jgi:hypothetical protein
MAGRPILLAITRGLVADAAGKSLLVSKSVYS